MSTKLFCIMKKMSELIWNWFQTIVLLTNQTTNNDREEREISTEDDRKHHAEERKNRSYSATSSNEDGCALVQKRKSSDKNERHSYILPVQKWSQQVERRITFVQRCFHRTLYSISKALDSLWIQKNDYFLSQICLVTWNIIWFDTKNEVFSKSHAILWIV